LNSHTFLGGIETRGERVVFQSWLDPKDCENITGRSPQVIYVAPEAPVRLLMRQGDDTPEKKEMEL